jgi:hypothetical protein
MLTPISHRRAIPVILVLVPLVARSAQASDRRAAVASASQPVVSRPSAPPDLASALASPDRRVTNMARMLRACQTRDGKPFDLDARDRLVARAGEVLARANVAGDLHVLVVETVNGGGGGAEPPRYDRAQLFAYDGGGGGGELPMAVRRDLSALGLREMPARAFAVALRSPLAAAMGAGGSNSGLKLPPFDVGHDVLVVTHYDGRAWRTEAWFWVLTAFNTDIVKVESFTRDGLPQPFRALIDIAEAVQPFGLYAKDFGHSGYRDIFEIYSRKGGQP